MRTALVLAAVAVTLAGCGAPPRAQGDAGGVPVTFTVEISPDYVAGMSVPAPYLRPPLFVHDLSFHHYGHFGHNGHRHYGHRHFGPGSYPAFWGYGYDPFYDVQPTVVAVLAGDGPGQDQLFRAEVYPRLESFTVPVRAGRQITLTLQVSGSRSGWESLGTFTAADRPGQLIAVRATDRVTLTATPPPTVSR